MSKSKISLKLVTPVLMAFFVMSFCDLVGIGVDRVKLEFGLSNTLAQLIPSAVFLWFFVLSVPVGVLQDRIGKRNVLNLGMVITIFGLLIPFLFYTFEMVLIGFTLLGIGNTIVQVSANPLLVDVVPSNKRSSFLSFSQFVKAVGSMVAAPLAGWLAAQYGDWKILFVVFGVVSVLAVVWLASTKIVETKNTEQRATFMSSFKLLGNSFVSVMVICIFLIVGIDVGINAVSGQFLLGKFSSEQTLAESARSLYFFGKMLGTFGGAIILAKFSSRKFFVWSSVLGLLSMVGLIFAPTEFITLIIIFIVGLGIANIFPLVFSLTVERYPERANEISGLMIMAVSGGAVLPPLMGWIADLSSVTASVMVLVVSICFILIVSLYVGKQKLNKILIHFVFVLFFISCAIKKDIEPKFDAVQYVDPQIGSVHGRWFFYTPAALPFGMAKLAPHTNAYNGPGSWMPQGYDDRHNSIEGFGHFHEFQIGGLVVMPATGKLKTVPGTLENPDEGYRSRFDKETEYAEAGFYSVLLKDYNIKAELTATERVGFHRYLYPESKKSHLIFDIGHMQGESKTVTDAFVQMIDNYEVEGYIETLPEYLTFCDPENRVTMYFVMKLDKKPESFGTFVNEDISRNERKSKGIENGMYFSFSTKQNEVVELQVGLSYTSIENARVNLKAESKGQTFEQVKETAKQKWNEKLGRLKVEGGSENDRIKFYTALYHAILGRGLASDVNGQFIQNDNTIGQIPLDKEGHPKYNHYNTDGIWGAFWNLGQLWALAYPDFMSDYVQTNIDFYKNSGWLHDGMAAGAYTNGVQTNFQALFMASAYNCGIRDFDLITGYNAAVKNELDYNGRNAGNGKYDLSYFVEGGYVPSLDFKISSGWTYDFGCSHTLEYAFSSYAVAQMAQSLGHDEDYATLIKQSDYWKNIFDTETKFIRPRYQEGNFVENFNPMEGWRGFQEGNAYQYTWYVPHDQAGLIDLIGVDLYNERLEKTFTESQKSTFGGGDEIDSFSGVEKLYNHGNQPCLHQPWLFNYSGKPWLTQKWTRTICNEFYGTTPLQGYGYGQDEDQGQLGAWYVMASIGLFDVQGHAASNPTFQFGSPMFDRITIQLDNSYYQGKELVIETTNNSMENIYMQSASFNGDALENCWIDRSVLTKGGTLRFEMGNEPNKQWGIKTAPSSMSKQ